MSGSGGATAPPADAIPDLQVRLSRLVQDALRQAPHIDSLALGDRQGLPIIDATHGGIPVMTFTAMATMSLRAAGTACESIELPAPKHIAVDTSEGQLIVMRLPRTDGTLIARLRKDANVGLCLLILRELGGELDGALEE